MCLSSCLSHPQDIKETGRGLGLTVCQKGSSIIGSLIATHIPIVSNYPQNLEQVVWMTVLLEYFETIACSIRVV